MGELLPCPFCGREPVRDFEPNSYRIACGTAECPAALGWLYFTEADAIAAWNRRAGGSAQQDDERAREALKRLQSALLQAMAEGQDGRPMTYVHNAFAELPALRAALLRTSGQPAPRKARGFVQNVPDHLATWSDDDAG